MIRYPLGLLDCSFFRFLLKILFIYVRGLSLKEPVNNRADGCFALNFNTVHLEVPLVLDHGLLLQRVLYSGFVGYADGRIVLELVDEVIPSLDRRKLYTLPQRRQSYGLLFIKREHLSA